MQKRTRHRFFLIYLFLFIGCASNLPSDKAFYKRTKKVSYDVEEVHATHYPTLFQKHLLIAEQDSYHVHGFQKGDDYILIADSEEAETKEVACTLIKAQGRKAIVKWVSSQLYTQNQGKAWDLFLKGRGQEVVEERLLELLKNEKKTFFYWERREIERAGEDFDRFVCAVAISFGQKEWQEVASPLREEILKEHPHVNTSALDLSFPVSEAR